MFCYRLQVTGCRLQVAYWKLETRCWKLDKLQTIEPLNNRKEVNKSPGEYVNINSFIKLNWCYSPGDYVNLFTFAI